MQIGENVNSVRIADNFVPAIPLFHAFGRVGCFLGGCCYGIEYHGHFAITFTNALSEANGVARFPVQLLETGINVGIFAALLLFERLRSRRDCYRPLQNLGFYLILYGITRFFLEYLRGDAARGFLGPFATSQRISLAVIPIGIWVLLCETDKNFIVRKLFHGDLPNETPIPINPSKPIDNRIA